jgi:hypothetical protein
LHQTLRPKSFLSQTNTLADWKFHLIVAVLSTLLLLLMNWFTSVVVQTPPQVDQTLFDKAMRWLTSTDNNNNNNNTQTAAWIVFMNQHRTTLCAATLGQC